MYVSHASVKECNLKVCNNEQRSTVSDLLWVESFPTLLVVQLLSVSDGSILQNSPENSTDQIDWGDLEVGGGGEVGDGEVGGGGEVGDGEVGGGREVGDGEVGGDREVDLEDVDMSTIEVVEDSICIEDSGTATEAGDGERVYS